MNSGDKFFLWIFFGVSVLLTIIIGSVIILERIDKIHIENMAKEGYIQKVEGTHTIWIKPNAEQ